MTSPSPPLPLPSSPSKAACKGFTLAEIALSVGIAAICLITLLGLLPYGLDTLRTTHTTLLEQGETASFSGGRTPGEDDRYIACQIRPDGRTNLPRGPGRTTALTLIVESAQGVPFSLPPDYRTLVIDPLNGSVRTY